MRLLVTAVTLAMASLLLAAGVEKTRNVSSFAATLRELGLARASHAAAGIVIAAEIAVALALIFAPGTPFAMAGAIALAIGFAAAAMIAIRRKATIRCNCFGAYGDGTLGRKQLFALPLWIAGAALLWQEGAVIAVSGAAMFAMVGLTLAAIGVVMLVPAAIEARGDRRSAKEMFVWMRS